jgi:hypothetical protein
MLRVFAIAAAAVSAFFIFYTIRLLTVTGFLQHTRPGGGGAYIGAVIFPLIAIASGVVAVRAWRRAARTPTPNPSHVMK